MEEWRSGGVEEWSGGVEEWSGVELGLGRDRLLTRRGFGSAGASPSLTMDLQSKISCSNFVTHLVPF